jgi:hypothetical protein
VAETLGLGVGGRLGPGVSVNEGDGLGEGLGDGFAVGDGLGVRVGGRVVGGAVVTVAVGFGRSSGFTSTLFVSSTIGLPDRYASRNAFQV